MQTSLRVKNEFVNALRQSGVSDADIAAVRQELGLGDADGKGFSLKDLKPLTRAKPREILDRFSKTINDNAGVTVIKNRWAGDKARQTSNADLGRTIAAATEARLAGINKGIGVSMRKGALGSLPSNIKRDLNALNLSAGAVKNFAKLAGHMLEKSSADVGDIAAAALKKTLLAELGGKLKSDEARNMLKSIAKATTGSLTAVGQRLSKAPNALMNQSAIYCFYHMQAGSPGDRVEKGAPPLYKLDPAGSKITVCGDVNQDEDRPIFIAQPRDGALNYSVDLDPKTNTATIRSGCNYRIAASQSNPRIFSLNSESEGTAFGSVFCECTFTVTGIGSGNPQISATHISQTFNMD